MTERIALFGGTFDPVHQGHMNACSQIFEELELTQLFLIPAFRPVHKDLPEVSIQNRLDMLNLSCADYDYIDCDQREITRGGPSYTLFTIQEYREQHPDACLFFILGMDALENFDSWYQWRDFLSLVNLVIVDRPGVEPEFSADLQSYLSESETQNLSSFKNSKQGLIFHSKRAMLRYSSTEVRSNIHNPAEITKMLPEKVLNYINQHKLYR